MITASDGEYRITQNASQFRTVESRQTAEDAGSSEDEGNGPDSHQTSESSGIKQGTRKSSRIGKQTEFYGQLISH